MPPPPGRAASYHDRMTAGSRDASRHSASIRCMSASSSASCLRMASAVARSRNRTSLHSIGRCSNCRIGPPASSAFRCSVSSLIEGSGTRAWMRRWSCSSSIWRSTADARSGCSSFSRRSSTISRVSAAAAGQDDRAAARGRCYPNRTYLLKPIDAIVRLEIVRRCDSERDQHVTSRLSKEKRASCKRRTDLEPVRSLRAAAVAVRPVPAARSKLAPARVEPVVDRAVVEQVEASNVTPEAARWQPESLLSLEVELRLAVEAP